MINFASVRQRVGRGHCPRPGLTSKTVNVRDTQDQRVNIGGADGRAVQGHVAFDIDPARVEAHRAFVTDLIIDAQLHGHTDAVIQAENAKCRGFFEKRGVVDAKANKRLELAGGGEVVVQRHGGRQVTDIARRNRIVQRDVMFERRGGQQLDAQIVAQELFNRKRQLRVAVDRCRQGCQRSVVGFRVHVRNANAKGPIALGLRCNRGCQEAQRSGAGGKDGKCLHLSLAGLNDAVGYGDSPVRDFDLGQSEYALRCGIRAQSQT